MINLERAPISLKPTLRELLSRYLVELATFQGAPIERGEDGHVPYYWFDHYWLEPDQQDRIPFVIWLADELAGFCLLRDTGEAWDVAEFFVLPDYRRRGAGAAAVEMVKEFCRKTGRHEALFANTLHANLGALAFWRKQGFVTVGENDEQLINVFHLK